jgi:hypothetical protein
MEWRATLVWGPTKKSTFTSTTPYVLEEAEALSFIESFLILSGLPKVRGGWEEVDIQSPAIAPVSSRNNSINGGRNTSPVDL